MLLGRCPLLRLQGWHTHSAAASAILLRRESSLTDCLSKRYTSTFRMKRRSDRSNSSSTNCAISDLNHRGALDRSDAPRSSEDVLSDSDRCETLSSPFSLIRHDT